MGAGGRTLGQSNTLVRTTCDVVGRVPGLMFLLPGAPASNPHAA